MNKGAFLHGTSGWSYKDWIGPFYPLGTPEKEFLKRYAARFNAVEIDSTFYRTPAHHSAKAWFDATPAGFLFFPKMVEQATHQNFADTSAAVDSAAGFMNALSPMRGKIGAVVLQFPYYKKDEGVTLEVFLSRLLPLLDKIPKDERLAVEVRNKTFLKPELLAALRDRGVSLVLNDHPWMPRPLEFGKIEGVFTSDLAIIRLLGDRYAIEKITKQWGETVIDKTRTIEDWASVAKAAMRDGVTVAAFANNHFAGYAPESIETLAKMVEAGA